MKRSTRLPIPTQDEITAASVEGRGIVAVSGKRTGPLIALKLAWSGPEETIVLLDAVGQTVLLEALKVLIPLADQSPPASPVIKFETPDGVEVQAGFLID